EILYTSSCLGGARRGGGRRMKKKKTGKFSPKEETLSPQVWKREKDRKME
ncbi:hypothetical protein CSUI_008058, partial [Cystoisospora suis]